MGTRASFWIGDARNIQDREYMGCIAFDGYPEGLPGIENITTADRFREFVGALSKRGDFSSATEAFPFPWPDDLFLTDETYSFMEGAVWREVHRKGWMKVADSLDEDKFDEFCAEHSECRSFNKVPAHASYDPTLPDSIMVISRL